MSDIQQQDNVNGTTSSTNNCSGSSNNNISNNSNEYSSNIPFSTSTTPDQSPTIPQRTLYNPSSPNSNQRIKAYHQLQALSPTAGNANPNANVNTNSMGSIPTVTSIPHHFFTRTVSSSSFNSPVPGSPGLFGRSSNLCLSPTMGHDDGDIKFLSSLVPARILRYHMTKIAEEEEEFDEIDEVNNDTIDARTLSPSFSLRRFNNSSNNNIGLTRSFNAMPFEARHHSSISMSEAKIRTSDDALMPGRYDELNHLDGIKKPSKKRSLTLLPSFALSSEDNDERTTNNKISKINSTSDDDDDDDDDDGEDELSGNVPPLTPVNRDAHKLDVNYLEPFCEEFEAAVLFADISGFSLLAEKLVRDLQSTVGGSKVEAMAAEKLANSIGKSLNKMVEMIVSRGGDVIKFAGDAILAVFPAKFYGDDLTQANLCCSQVARELVLLKLQTDDGREGLLTIHCGIGSGKVVGFHVGGLRGRYEYFITGKPVDEIGQTEPQAKAGQVVISSTVYNSIAEHCKGSFVEFGNFLLEEIVNPRLFPEQMPILSEIGKFAQGKPKRSTKIKLSVKSYVPPPALRFGGKSMWSSDLRRCSTLFCKLNGLPFKDKDSIPLIQKVMNEIVQKHIYELDGNICRFIVDDKGTVVLAAFGLPPGHENDSVRSCKAAMKIRESIRLIGDKSISCSIGITRGPVCCGTVGGNTRCEYTVHGKIVNIAARLMSAANGGILCDEETQKDSCSRITFEGPTVLELKSVGKFEAFKPVGDVPKGTKYQKGRHSALTLRDVSNSSSSTSIGINARTSSGSGSILNFVHSLTPTSKHHKSEELNNGASSTSPSKRRLDLSLSSSASDGFELEESAAPSSAAITISTTDHEQTNSTASGEQAGDTSATPLLIPSSNETASSTGSERGVENPSSSSLTPSDDQSSNKLLTEQFGFAQALEGREYEIEVINEKLTELTGVEAFSGVLVIEGEAGIGKSTLCKYIAAKAEVLETVVLEGHGFDMESSTPFFLWSSLITQVLDIHIANFLHLNRSYFGGVSGAQGLLPHVSSKVMSSTSSKGNPSIGSLNNRLNRQRSVALMKKLSIPVNLNGSPVMVPSNPANHNGQAVLNDPDDATVRSGDTKSQIQLRSNPSFEQQQQHQQLDMKSHESSPHSTSDRARINALEASPNTTAYLQSKGLIQLNGNSVNGNNANNNGVETIVSNMPEILILPEIISSTNHTIASSSSVQTKTLYRGVKSGSKRSMISSGQNGQNPPGSPLRENPAAGRIFVRRQSKGSQYSSVQSLPQLSSQSDNDDQQLRNLRSEALSELVPQDMQELIPLLSSVLPDVVPAKDNETTAKMKGEVRGRALRQLIVDIMKKFVVDLQDAAQKRIVLIVEDLQWVDPASRKVLINLSKAATRLLLCITIRDLNGELKERVKDYQSLPNFHKLCLKNLTKEQIGSCICTWLRADDISESALDAIFKKSQGQPHFAEELCRLMVDMKILMVTETENNDDNSNGNDEIEDEQVKAETIIEPYERMETFSNDAEGSLHGGKLEKIGSQKAMKKAKKKLPINGAKIKRIEMKQISDQELEELLPKSIDALMVSRLDRLSPSEQLTTSIASVIGVEFKKFELAGIMPRENNDISAKQEQVELDVNSLTLKGIFNETLSGDGTASIYRFSHVLIRDSAYSHLPFETKKQLHRQIAEFKLTRSGVIPNYLAIANHFYLAEDWEKAVLYFEKAGDDAKEIHGMQQVYFCFTRLLEISEKHPNIEGVSILRKAKWSRKASEASLDFGRLEEAESGFFRALRMLQLDCRMVDELKKKKYNQKQQSSTLSDKLKDERAESGSLDVKAQDTQKSIPNGCFPLSLLFGKKISKESEEKVNAKRLSGRATKDSSNHGASYHQSASKSPYVGHLHRSEMGSSPNVLGARDAVSSALDIHHWIQVNIVEAATTTYMFRQHSDSGIRGSTLSNEDASMSQARSRISKLGMKNDGDSPSNFSIGETGSKSNRSSLLSRKQADPLLIAQATISKVNSTQGRRGSNTSSSSTSSSGNSGMLNKIISNFVKKKPMKPRSVRDLPAYAEYQMKGEVEVFTEAAKIYEKLGRMNENRSSPEALERRLNSVYLAEAAIATRTDGNVLSPELSRGYANMAVFLAGMQPGSKWRKKAQIYKQRAIKFREMQERTIIRDSEAQLALIYSCGQIEAMGGNFSEAELLLRKAVWGCKFLHVDKMRLEFQKFQLAVGMFRGHFGGTCNSISSDFSHSDNPQYLSLGACVMVICGDFETAATCLEKIAQVRTGTINVDPRSVIESLLSTEDPETWLSLSLYLWRHSKNAALALTSAYQAAYCLIRMDLSDMPFTMFHTVALLFNAIGDIIEALNENPDALVPPIRPDHVRRSNVLLHNRQGSYAFSSPAGNTNTLPNNGNSNSSSNNPAAKMNKVVADLIAPGTKNNEYIHAAQQRLKILGIQCLRKLIPICKSFARAYPPCVAHYLYCEVYVDILDEKVQLKRSIQSSSSCNPCSFGCMPSTNSQKFSLEGPEPSTASALSLTTKKQQPSNPTPKPSISKRVTKVIKSSTQLKIPFVKGLALMEQEADADGTAWREALSIMQQCSAPYEAERARMKLRTIGIEVDRLY